MTVRRTALRVAWLAHLALLLGLLALFLGVAG